MSAPSTILFTFRQIPTIAAMLAERGIEVTELLRTHDLPPEGASGEITAPLTRIQAFIDSCAQRLAMPLFGIELADRLPRGAFGVTEFVVRAAPTVQDGLSALCELSPLINPLIDMRYIADARGCEIHFAYGGLRDGLGMQLNEYTIEIIARTFSSVIGKPLPLERAWFEHTRREHADDVAQRLACNVMFQAADSGFAVTSDVIGIRPTSADPALFAFLLAQARTQLSNIGRNNVVAQVTRAIEARLAISEVSAATIADAMSTTARSLQRHLADAGTSFREVLSRVRLRRRDELERLGLSAAEIAPKLGFANARSMKRSLDESGDEE